MPPSPSVHGQTQTLWERQSDLPISQKVTRLSGPEAARNVTATGLVSKIFNESFGHRPDGKPYRLGPKSMAERLASTDLLFIAGDEQSGIGYLFGKEIPSMSGRIAWIESMAVLPLYRRQGIATALIHQFRLATKGSVKNRMRDPESHCGFGGHQSRTRYRVYRKPQSADRGAAHASRNPTALFRPSWMRHPEKTVTNKNRVQPAFPLRRTGMESPNAY